MDIKLGIYRHFKGNEYEVIGVGTHTETEEKMVIYRDVGNEKNIWIRPLEMFFDTVDRDGHLQPRFTFLKEL